MKHRPKDDETPTGTEFVQPGRAFVLQWTGARMMELWSQGGPIVSSTQWTPAEAVNAGWIPVYPESLARDAPESERLSPVCG